MASEFDTAMEDLRDAMHSSAFADSTISYIIPERVDPLTINGIWETGARVAAEKDGATAKLEVKASEFTDGRVPRQGDLVATATHVFRAFSVDPPEYATYTIWFVVQSRIE